MFLKRLIRMLQPDRYTVTRYDTDRAVIRDRMDTYHYQIVWGHDNTRMLCFQMNQEWRQGA